MSSATYNRRKATGVCPTCGVMPAQAGFVQCPDCRFKTAQESNHRLTSAEWQVHEALRLSRGTSSHSLAAHIPGPAVGHCGLFWPATMLPVRCGACGGVALGEGA